MKYEEASAESSAGNEQQPALDEEEERLLAGADDRVTATLDTTRVMIIFCLACISCSAFIAWNAYVAGVAHWTKLYGNEGWITFNLVAAVNMPPMILCQFYFDRIFNVRFGAMAAYAFRLAFGVLGLTGLMASTPWATEHSEGVFYLYAFLNPVCAMSISGAISQITAYMTPDMVAYLRTGQSMPAFLVLLLVLATSYHYNATTDATIRFHVAAGLLTLLFGSTYLLLPGTTAIRLVLRLESIEKEDGAEDKGFWEMAAQAPMQLAVCQASSLWYQTVVVTSPLVPTQQSDGQLAQQIVLIGISLDVVGKLCAAGRLGDAARAFPAVTPTLCALNVTIGPTVLGLYCAGILEGDWVANTVAGGACLLTGFCFTVANQQALQQVPLQHSPQMMCIINLVISVSCVTVAAVLMVKLSVESGGFS